MDVIPVFLLEILFQSVDPRARRTDVTAVSRRLTPTLYVEAPRPSTRFDHSGQATQQAPQSEWQARDAKGVISILPKPAHKANPAEKVQSLCDVQRLTRT